MTPRTTVQWLEMPLPEDPKERKLFLSARRRAMRREAWDRYVDVWERRISGVGNYCYGGAVKIVQFPAYAFDLLDRYGKPDHSKIGPFLVSQELVAICAYDVIKNGRPLQASIVVVIAVLSFASMSLMRKFLDKTKVDVVSETTIADIRSVDVKEIAARRGDREYEPTP